MNAWSMAADGEIGLDPYTFKSDPSVGPQVLSIPKNSSIVAVPIQFCLLPEVSNGSVVVPVLGGEPPRNDYHYIIRQGQAVLFECIDENELTGAKKLYCSADGTFNDDFPICAYRNPKQKPYSPVVTTVLKGAQCFGCSWIIGTMSACFIMFAILRVFSKERVLQMGQEVSLILGHTVMLLAVEPSESNYGHQIFFSLLSLKRFITSENKNPALSEVAGMTMQFPFITNISFCALEALNTFIICMNISSAQSSLLQSVSAVIVAVLCVICLAMTAVAGFGEYSADFSCWVNYGSAVIVVGTMVPVSVITIVTLMITESSFMLGDSRVLPHTDHTLRTTALVSRSSLPIKTLLTTTSFVLGSLAAFNLNAGLTAIVFPLNLLMGWYIWSTHTMAEPKMRLLVTKLAAKAKAVLVGRNN